MIRLGDLLLDTGLHLEGKKGATKLGTASVSPKAVAPRKRSQARPVMISRRAPSLDSYALMTVLTYEL